MLSSRSGFCGTLDHGSSAGGFGWGRVSCGTVPGRLLPFLPAALSVWLLEVVTSVPKGLHFSGTTFLSSGVGLQEPLRSPFGTEIIHTPNSQTEGGRVFNSVSEVLCSTAFYKFNATNHQRTSELTLKASIYRASKKTLSGYSVCPDDHEHFIPKNHTGLSVTNRPK